MFPTTVNLFADIACAELKPIPTFPKLSTINEVVSTLGSSSILNANPVPVDVILRPVPFP